jgi:hypothetical protein
MKVGKTISRNLTKVHGIPQSFLNLKLSVFMKFHLILSRELTKSFSSHQYCRYYFFIFIYHIYIYIFFFIFYIYIFVIYEAKNASNFDRVNGA